MLDFGEERLNYLSFDNNKTCVTHEPTLLGKIRKLIFEDELYKDLTYTEKQPWDRNIYEIELYMKMFCQTVREYYEDKKITIVEVLLYN